MHHCLLFEAAEVAVLRERSGHDGEGGREDGEGTHIGL